MSRYRVSIVVPVYGVERYIRQFAESALGQTYQNIQFVFVNDGTKDRSIEILNELIEEKYQHLKPRILIVDKENQGLPMARKTGLEHAEGEYVLLLTPMTGLRRMLSRRSWPKPMRPEPISFILTS